MLVGRIVLKERFTCHDVSLSSSASRDKHSTYGVRHIATEFWGLRESSDNLLQLVFVPEGTMAADAPCPPHVPGGTFDMRDNNARIKRCLLPFTVSNYFRFPMMMMIVTANWQSRHLVCHTWISFEVQRYPMLNHALADSTITNTLTIYVILVRSPRRPCISFTLAFTVFTMKFRGARDKGAVGRGNLIISRIGGRYQKRY